MAFRDWTYYNNLVDSEYIRANDFYIQASDRMHLSLTEPKFSITSNISPPGACR
jgi:hypothetical protein